MNKQTHFEESLATKFLAGEASPDEAIQLNDWIEESDEHRTYFKELESVWMGNSRNVTAPVASEAWHSLQARLAPVRRKAVLLTPYRIAATLLLLVCCGAVIYFLRSSADAPALSWNSKQTHNEVTAIGLSDGTSVTINRESNLSWPKQFEPATREVKLVGEAFFDVTHDPSRSFIISTDDIKIKVLGTAFNVLQDKDHKEIKIDVARGKVMMYNTVKSIIVEAGMTGVYHQETKSFTLHKMQNKNTMAYATHALSFTNANLDEICEQLSKAYGVRFQFKNDKLKACRLTTEYQDKSLPFIMNIIGASLNIDYYIEDNTVYISGNGCF